jgi:hypothetical protein
MTGLGFTGNIVAILVLLLVIGMTWLVLRSRLAQSAVSRRRKRADKGKVRCQHHWVGLTEYGDEHCKSKARWVTPHGYFCDEHWEIHSTRTTAHGKVRWAHKLVWAQKGTDVWTT